MVAQTQFQPQKPDALISPDQSQNQFRKFNKCGVAVWPSSYAGMPTNAMGQPIQPPPGTTLNSSPQPAAPQAAAPQPNSAQQLYNQMSGPSALHPTGNPAFGASEWGFGLGAQGGGGQELACVSDGPERQRDRRGAASETGVPGTDRRPRLRLQPLPRLRPTVGKTQWRCSPTPGKRKHAGSNCSRHLQAPSRGVGQTCNRFWLIGSRRRVGRAAGSQQNFATALKGMGY